MSNLTVSGNLSSNGSQLANYIPKLNSQIRQISDHEKFIRSQLTYFQRLTSYELQSFNAIDPDTGIEYKGLNHELPAVNEGLFEDDRKEGLAKINNILEKVNKIKDQYDLERDSVPVCPYEQTLIEYLGPNYIIPSIRDLPVPVNFSAQVALDSAISIDKHYHNVMMNQLHMMSAEAMKPESESLPAVLGHAFTMLSSLPNGEEVLVIDKEKTAKHLNFAELVRNLSIEDILDNPYVVAQKLLAQFVEINQDAVKEQALALK
jgi:hypothetical protein